MPLTLSFHSSSEEVYAAPIEAGYPRLSSSPSGLTTAEAMQRLLQYGWNTLREERPTSLCAKLGANFTRLMALLLWVGGGIGFVANMPQLGIAIWTVNVINGLFSRWQEYKAEKAIAALRRLLPASAQVLRNGQER